MLDIIGISAAVVALAEMGDKTQLLAIVLAARFRRPVTILFGILAATLLNHAAAAALGFFMAQWLSGTAFQYIIGFGFLAMAGWTLLPDAQDARGDTATGAGVFLTTFVVFFVVEIGDKTQIATSLLAARFRDIALVAFGTTLGMMLANAPAVYLGEAVTRIAPLERIRPFAAFLFAAIGAWIVFNAARA